MEVLCQLKLHKNRLWRLQKTFFLCMLWLLINKTTPAVWAHYSRTCLPIWLHFTSTYGTDKCFYIAACVFDKSNVKSKTKIWSVKVKTTCENKTIPECQWTKDWPHLPLTSPPSSSHSYHPSHLPGLAPSSATKQNTSYHHHVPCHCLSNLLS